jgi:hypothetical protein
VASTGALNGNHFAIRFISSSESISTVSEVFLQNHASPSRPLTARKLKNAMNWLSLKLNPLQNHGLTNLQYHRLNDNAARILLQLRREVPTQQDILAPSFKTAVSLTEGEALALAAELLSVVASRRGFQPESSDEEPE